MLENAFSQSIINTYIATPYKLNIPYLILFMLICRNQII